jgi:hypothetical protein
MLLTCCMLPCWQLQLHHQHVVSALIYYQTVTAAAYGVCQPVQHILFCSSSLCVARMCANRQEELSSYKAGNIMQRARIRLCFSHDSLL